MGNTEKLPTVLSFCSGYAGIERGLDLAGFRHRVLSYVEIEAFAIENLVNKMEAGKLDPALIFTDLKLFPSRIFRDKVELITGGYPCQPFSTSGARAGEEDDRHLWPIIRRKVQDIRPNRCFFENVEGHITLGLSTVLSDLEEDGYDTTWGIFSASEVGGHHQRKRVFILANSREKRGQNWVPRSFGQIEERDSSKSDNSSYKPDGWERPSDWSIEPSVCRMVDGCPNRVDRIGMLGNGVVPSTAALAWTILNERFNEKII